MNDYLERHPGVTYMLILVILFLMNVFWRWRNGDAWTDVWLLSLVSTVMIGGGVILGNFVRRKYKKKHRATRQKMEDLLSKK